MTKSDFMKEMEARCSEELKYTAMEELGDIPQFLAEYVNCILDRVDEGTEREAFGLAFDEWWREELRCNWLEDGTSVQDALDRLVLQDEVPEEVLALFEVE